MAQRSAKVVGVDSLYTDFDAMAARKGFLSTKFCTISRAPTSLGRNNVTNVQRNSARIQHIRLRNQYFCLWLGREVLE